MSPTATRTGALDEELAQEFISEPMPVDSLFPEFQEVMKQKAAKA